MKPKCEDVKRKSGKKTHVPKLDLSALSETVISEQSHSNWDESKKKKGHDKEFVQKSEPIPLENSVISEQSYSNRDDNKKKKGHGHGLFHSSSSSLSPPWQSRHSHKSRARSVSGNSLSPKRLESDEIEINEPQSPSSKEYFFELDVFKIIEMDDPYYGETLAYNATKFINQRDTSPLRKQLEKLTVYEYIELKTLEINTIQAEKIKLIQQMINLLNCEYSKQQRTSAAHYDLKKEIKQVIVLTMCTTLKSYEKKVELLNMSTCCAQEKFGEFFEKFWIGLMCDYLPGSSMSQEEFKLHLINLHLLYDNAFELVEQLQLFRLNRLSDVKDSRQIYFLTMNYFSDTCRKVLNKATCDQFFEAYSQENPTTECICIIDILVYIYDKKKSFGADLLSLDLIEAVLKNLYLSPYQHFLMELNRNKLSVKEEQSSKAKFRMTS